MAALSLGSALVAVADIRPSGNWLFRPRPVLVIMITGPQDLVLRSIVQFREVDTGVVSVLLGPLVPTVCCDCWATKSSHLVESREGGLRVI